MNKNVVSVPVIYPGKSASSTSSQAQISTDIQSVSDYMKYMKEQEKEEKKHVKKGKSSSDTVKLLELTKDEERDLNCRDALKKVIDGMSMGKAGQPHSISSKVLSKAFKRNFQANFQDWKKTLPTDGRERNKAIVAAKRFIDKIPGSITGKRGNQSFVP